MQSTVSSRFNHQCTLCEGDLIEFHRGTYCIYAIYIGNNMVIRFRPLGYKIRNVPFCTFVPAALVIEEPLTKVAGTSRYRVDNRPEIAKATRSYNEMLQVMSILLHKPVFTYSKKYFSSEHFATFVKYGEAYSSRLKFLNPALTDGVFKFLLNNEVNVYDMYNKLATYQWQENLKACENIHFPRLLLEEGITFLQANKLTLWATDYHYCDPDEGDIIEIQKKTTSYWAIYIGRGQVAYFTPHDLGNIDQLQPNTCLSAVVVVDDLEKLQGSCEIRVNNKQEIFKNTTPRSLPEILNLIELLLNRVGFFYCSGVFNSEHFVTFIKFREARSQYIVKLLTNGISTDSDHAPLAVIADDITGYCNKMATEQWHINLEAAVFGQTPKQIVSDFANFCEFDSKENIFSQISCNANNNK